MKWTQNSKQILAGLTFGFLVVTGTYNAVVINSESMITGADVRFAKRLDEVYGVVKPGREVAASLKWQKLSVHQAAIAKTKIRPEAQLAQKAPVSIPAQVASTREEVPAQAAVQEDLNLNLAEVINPKKWQQGLNSSQFNGSLSTNNGVIESLSVSLPNGEGVSVSFSEMTGNVFEYDFNGDLYSGMMYQVDQNSYMVTLTNGPLEGTRLKFIGEPSLEQQIQMEESQRELAQNNESQHGGYQETPQTQEVAVQQEVFQPEVQQNLENQDIYSQEQGQMEQNQQVGYNFEMQQAM